MTTRLTRPALGRPALLGLVLAAWLGLAATPGRTLAQEASVPDSKLYPLAVGSQWDYEINVPNGPKGAITATVQGVDEVDGVACAVLQSTTRGQIAGTELLRGGPEGVKRYSFNGKPVQPPVLFLKDGAKVGDKWTTTVEVSGQELTFTYEVTGLDEPVKVPAGEYKATVVRTRFQAPGQDKPTEVTFYYAPEVGPVKNVVAVGDQQVAIELTKFTKGGAEAAKK